MKRAGTLALLAATFAGCGDGTGPQGVQMEFSVDAITDTINARISQPVRVRIVDGNRPVGNETVIVRAYPSSVSPTPAWTSETLSTDAQGTLSLYVFLGNVAGESSIVLETRGHVDSIRVTTLPGAAVAAGFVVEDTALVVGESFAPQVRAVDRRGNRRSEILEPASLTSTNPAVATATGASITAVATGYTAVRAATPLGEATAHIYVPPAATLAAGLKVALVNTMGDTIRVLSSDITTCRAWAPDGSHLLVHGVRKLLPDGIVTPVPGTSTVLGGCAEYSADGRRIVFDGRLAGEPETSSSIWIVNADGSGLKRLTDAGATGRHRSPTASPDGSRVAFLDDSRVPGALVVVDVETGAQDTIYAGHLLPEPRWSPDGEWIAASYLTLTIVFGPERHQQHWQRGVLLMRPDGSDRRYAVTFSRANGFESGLTWSPDGEWLVGQSLYPDLRFAFLRVSTGEVLLSRHATSGLDYPVWRP